MIKFGTLKSVDKEDIKISVAKLESSSYKDGKKLPPIITTEIEFEIKYSIDNDNYYYDFYITKPFEDYLELKNYDKIKIEEQYIHEDFTTLNDVSASLPSLEIKVQRINDNLIFVIDGKAFFDEYFCTIECEYPLEKIKNTLKEIR